MQEVLGTSVDPSTTTTISWTELRAFALSTSLIKEGWELKTVRSLAENYLKAVHEAQNPLCIPPVERATHD